MGVSLYLSSGSSLGVVCSSLSSEAFFLGVSHCTPAPLWPPRSSILERVFSPLGLFEPFILRCRPSTQPSWRQPTRHTTRRSSAPPRSHRTVYPLSEQVRVAAHPATEWQRTTITSGRIQDVNEGECQPEGERARASNWKPRSESQDKEEPARGGVRQPKGERARANRTVRRRRSTRRHVGGTTRSTRRHPVQSATPCQDQTNGVAYPLSLTVSPTSQTSNVSEYLRDRLPTFPPLLS